MSEILEDVVVTRQFMDPKEWGFYALCFMQVCAHSEIPPEQVEARANALNPTGIRDAWKIVWGKGQSELDSPDMAPAPCRGESETGAPTGRIHYLLGC